MTIQEVKKILFNERQDYGIYWIVNKLEQKNVSLNYGSENDGFTFSAWLSNKEGNFIIPKLSKRWERQGYYNSFYSLRPYAIIDAVIKSGINKNICISITIKPIKQKQ